jgi:trans-aconitate methyltransferase
MASTQSYRWNTSVFAVGYDAAAERIHPHYLAIQDVILNRIGSTHADQAALVVDLGGGSGRLMERLLDRFPTARAVVIDQSEPFLALAERRLSRFGERAAVIKSRLQEDWPDQLPQPADFLVSMSAIHHLEPEEKQRLYQRCFAALGNCGEFLNGDEVRAESDADYHRELSAWAARMRRGMAGGQIPPLFHDALNGWIDRNVARFGQPKRSGDDCYETIEVQLGYLRAAGFRSADCIWQSDMWAVMHAVK